LGEAGVSEKGFEPEGGELISVLSDATALTDIAPEKRGGKKTLG